MLYRATSENSTYVIKHGKRKMISEAKSGYLKRNSNKAR